MWLLALAGTPTLRHAEGKQELAPGDLICLPEGPAGGRSIANRGLKPVRVLMLWTTGLPAAVCYPDTGDWTLRAGSTVADINLRGT